MRFIQETPEGIAFYIHVQPRSSRNMIAGLHGDALKIKLTAPPVEGAANMMCLSFLAKCLGISKSSLAILSGHTSRRKLVLLRYKGIPTASEQVTLKKLIEGLASWKGNTK
jgi:uncharacterized protein (TIGR00251 family)